MTNMAESETCGSMLETNFEESKSLFDASVQSLSVKCNKLEWDGKTYRWTGNLFRRIKGLYSE